MQTVDRDVKLHAAEIEKLRMRLAMRQAES